jgi:hypothetical protein
MKDSEDRNERLVGGENDIVGGKSGASPDVSSVSWRMCSARRVRVRQEGRARGADPTRRVSGDVP